MAQDRIALTAAIAGLRAELSEAAKQAAGLGPNDVKFRITNVELELTVAAEDTASGGGEVGWWIFKANASVAAKDAVTHKVKLSLNVGDLAVSSTQDTA
jgi:hypothetical protein